MIRLVGRSLSVFFAIAIGTAIAFACFAPEDMIHRARAYVPISVSFPAKVAACPAEKPTIPTAYGVLNFSPAYLTEGNSKIFRASLTGVFHENVERQMVELLERGERDGATDMELLIDSNGGNIETAVHLAALISQSSISVHCLAGRNTQSAAFIVLQGCDDRAALPSSTLMEHQPYVVLDKPTRGHAAELRHYADGLNEVQKIMIEILAVRSTMTLGTEKGLTLDEVEKHLAEGDWTMTPTEAIGFGLLDRVVDSIVTFQGSIEGAATAAGSR